MSKRVKDKHNYLDLDKHTIVFANDYIIKEYDLLKSLELIDDGDSEEETQLKISFIKEYLENPNGDHRTIVV